MNGTDRAAVRSYQRIFRPDRRIYQVEGHRLPVPGGVPLRWLAYALGTLLAVIALSGRSPLLAAVVATAAGIAGWMVGGRAAAVILAVGGFGAAQLAGWMLAGLDWPLRLLIVPGLVATLATQATPDGRPAHRYALSWLALQLRPARRSLGRTLPAGGRARRHTALVGVAPDWHGRLRRGRVHGPATVTFSVPVAIVDRRGVLGRRMVARLPRGGERPADEVGLVVGERLEVRP